MEFANNYEICITLGILKGINYPIISNFVKMQKVFEEIRNIRIISGSSLMKLPKSKLVNEEYFDCLSSADYAKFGINNELYKMIYTEPDNKYCGKPIPAFEINNQAIRTQEFYKTYFKFQTIKYLTKDVIGYFYNCENDCFDYILQNQDNGKIREILRERRMASMKTRNYILNIKTGKCSCDGQKHRGFCKHQKIAQEEQIREKFRIKKVFEERFGNELSEDLIQHFTGM